VRGAQCPSLALRVFHDVFPKAPLSPLKGKMELVWGTNVEPTNLKWRKLHDPDGAEHPCSDKPPNFVIRTWRAFFDKSTAQGHCPYNGIAPVEGLLGSYDADIDHLIKDHVVFYGGALKGAQDTSYTPVNGLQANVFVHAMAMDNLISFQGKPYQNVMTVAGITMGNEPAQILAIIPAILVLSFMHMRRIRARKAAKHPESAEQERDAIYEWFVDKGIESFWHWFGFFLGLSIGLLLALWGGLSVANWVEVVFISVELAAMLLIGGPDSFWGYLHHVAGGVPDDTFQEERA